MSVTVGSATSVGELKMRAKAEANKGDPSKVDMLVECAAARRAFLRSSWRAVLPKVKKRRR